MGDSDSGCQFGSGIGADEVARLEVQGAALWAAHIGLSPTASSVIYGIAGLIDLMTFYPAGKVMDLNGRRWVAVPCAAVLGISFVVMPFTHAASTLSLTAVIMGFGNGIGSGIVMTLAADTSPEIGRPKFLGLWRELSDAGQGTGPLILSGVTAVAGLAAGITVSGVVGFAAAAAMWRFIPDGPGWQADSMKDSRRHRQRHRQAGADIGRSQSMSRRTRSSAKRGRSRVPGMTSWVAGCAARQDPPRCFSSVTHGLGQAVTSLARSCASDSSGV